jgi:N-acetylglucosamine repressor
LRRDGLLGSVHLQPGDALALFRTDSIVNAVDPARICIGGEIIAAWDLIEPAVRAALSERALSPDAAKTEIRIVTLEEHPRLRGAATLVAAPAFAAPPIA